MATERSRRGVGGPTRSVSSKTPDPGAPKASGTFTVLSLWGGPVGPYSFVSKAPTPPSPKSNTQTTVLSVYGGPGVGFEIQPKVPPTVTNFNIRKTLAVTGTRTRVRQKHRAD